MKELTNKEMVISMVVKSEEICDAYAQGHKKEAIALIMPLFKENGADALETTVTELMTSSNYDNSLTDPRFLFVLTRLARVIHDKVNITKGMEIITDVINESKIFNILCKKYHKIDKRLIVLLKTACPSVLDTANCSKTNIMENILGNIVRYADDVSGMGGAKIDKDQLAELLKELTGNVFIVDLCNFILVANDTELFSAKSNAVNDERRHVIRLVREACYNQLDDEISYNINGELVTWKIANQFKVKRRGYELNIKGYTNNVIMKLI